MVFVCLVCVFVHYCFVKNSLIDLLVTNPLFLFVENPLIDLDVTNPSFLIWFH
jgi:hypothetical protein